MENRSRPTSFLISSVGSLKTTLERLSSIVKGYISFAYLASMSWLAQQRRLVEVVNSPLGTVEDVHRGNSDQIVEKFNRFVHFLVDKQLYENEEGFDYETDCRQDLMGQILKNRGRL